MYQRGQTVNVPELRVVEAWHEALNDGAVDRLVELSHPEVEVGGPRGTGRGAQLLREWLERANIHLEPRRVFQYADTVVVEQWAQWRSTDTGQVIDGQTVGSVFIVRDGRVTRVVRYPNLEDALVATDLNESHEKKSN
jgi:ketosteroid isomerase-like protein